MSATAFRAENYPFLGCVRTAQSRRFRWFPGPNTAKTSCFVTEAHEEISLVGSASVRGGRESRLALSLVLASALLLGASLAGAQNSATLQRQQRVLAGKSQTALLGLFALDSRLARARGELARIQSRVAALHAEQRQARQELSVVAGNLQISQRLLGAHLRKLYEEGEPNALAILLDSSSLDDAVTNRSWRHRRVQPAPRFPAGARPALRKR